MSRIAKSADPYVILLVCRLVFWVRETHESDCVEEGFFFARRRVIDAARLHRTVVCSFVASLVGSNVRYHCYEFILHSFGFHVN